MRANVNARTKSSSYARWLIEKEDNPFINTRLEYTTSQPGIFLSKDLIGSRDKRHTPVSHIETAKSTTGAQMSQNGRTRR
jgi:hypothetical protein